MTLFPAARAGTEEGPRCCAATPAPRLSLSWARPYPPGVSANGPTLFRVTGMTCQNCARHAGEAARSVSGVREAGADLPAGLVRVRWQDGVEPDLAGVIGALGRAGFQAAALPAAAGSGAGPDAGAGAGAGGATAAAVARPFLGGWGVNVVVGGVLTLPLLLGEWVFRVGMEPWFQWLSFALALPVQAVCGARFYRGAWRQLRVRRANMDTLVALGSSTAFVYSVAALFSGAGGHLYFMEAAAIITLISVGHWLEARASARAESALRALLTLAPPTARWLGASGVETEVPVARLAPGDRVVLKPGDRVPVDAEVLEGDSAVDESMLTGESLPVEKSPGSRVYAGTANQNGRLIVRVAVTGEATALEQIVAAVRRAQDSRADIQRLADRVSSVFVPVVVLVALATAAWWGLAPESARAVHGALAGWLWHTHPPSGALAAAVVHAAAVLIVACPCAMGLATPIAIMAGANAAARRGILIRDGRALEKSGRLTGIVFDKTGTLTEGRAEVAASEDLRAEGNRSVPVDGIAAQLAARSDHPLSRAIARAGSVGGPAPAIVTAASLASAAGPAPGVRIAPGAGPATRSPGFPDFRLPPLPGRGAADRGASPASGGLELSDWRQLQGRGIEAGPASARWRLGSLAWLREAGVTVEAPTKFADNWTGKGATVVGLARGAELLACFALRDPVKPRAYEVVQRLQGAGQRVYLVTGDDPRTALAVAQQVGIPAERVHAAQRPEQKAEVLRGLQARGERLAFVGDGINDAPALEQADLGVAVSRASDVAREAADLVLLRPDLEAIPEAIGVAQATLRTIRQNLFWAFFYNAAAVPLAALGFLSPVLCAAAMGLSDLLVIGNALRLRRAVRGTPRN